MNRAKLSTTFYRLRYFRILPFYESLELIWKDKFQTPRCQSIPSFRFEWLWFGIYGQWGDDQYWEQWLWIHEYHDGDVQKAKDSWGWRDIKTNKSTWIDYDE